MNNHIFFISSYPKSGNTLMRLIISSLFFTKDGKSNFENLKFISQLENKIYLEFIKNINKIDFLKLNDLNTMYKYHVEIKEKKNLGFKEDFTFFKSHHLMNSFNGYNYINENQIRGIIYLVRDPRDIVLSWQNFESTTIKNAVNFIVNPYSAISWNDNIKSTLPKYIKPKVLISSWKKHVQSIITNKFKKPILIIKYEDLVKDKINILVKIIKFFKDNYKIQILNTDEKILNILETTSFETLKKNEENKSFKESTNSIFFNKGKVGNWKENLDKKYINIIEKEFKKEMLYFNYLE